MKRAFAHAAGVVLLAGLVGGCGGKSVAGDRISGQTLTIYSSLPFHGASSINGEAVVSGARLALARISGKIGRYQILFRPLDDSTAARRGWDPGQTTNNARIAIADKTTIGYLGEFNSGASAVSIPLLNRMGIAQVSPASTAVGLTSSGSGASPGEPQKYYPTGIRTFARVVPNDSVQAAAQVRLQLSVGCTKTYVVDDGEVDGEDAATSFQVAAQTSRLQLAGLQSFDPHATDYSALAATVAQSGADCVLISAATEDNAALVTKQIAAAAPGAKLLGSSGVAESTYTDPRQGGIPLVLDPRVLITVATLDPGSYPPAGRQFFDAYAARYGPPPPYAIFGYEAMSLMLDSIARATDDGTGSVQRSKVAAAMFATRDRHSALGTYSINADGDTSLIRYGVYRVVAGQLTFWKAIRG